MRKRWTDFQSLLAGGIRSFLQHKRALGRNFRAEESALRLLDRYLVEQGVSCPESLSSALLDDFLTTRPRVRPRSYNHLVGVLHRLFSWLVVQGDLPGNPLCARPRRATAQQRPYLFDIPTALRLLEAASGLPDRAKGAQRGKIYPMVFALLFGLGLRVGEVSRLHRADVDLDRRLLVIRNTKFSKTRLVPMGPRLADRLALYLRDAELYRGPLSPDHPVFSFGHHRPIHPGTISQTFHRLVPELGLDLSPGVSPPHLHHLRHSFAVATLLRWYRSGIDPGQRLLQLSTFMGHVNPTSTAVYLTITADLLQEAAGRFERFTAPFWPKEIPDE